MIKTTVITGICFLMAMAAPLRAQWSLAYRSALELNANGVGDIQELSGVTLLSSTSDTALLAGVQDSGGQVITIQVGLGSDATLTSAVAQGAISIADNGFDLEGIAFDGQEVYIAYERDPDSSQIIPGVRRYSLTSGERLLSLGLPSVWTTDGNTRNNRGFESLVRSSSGYLFTANEEALTIDGSASTPSSGTTVRIQELDPTTPSAAGRSQWAYEVEPPHGTSPDQSGLTDLAMLPDGTLLSLERSTSASLPVFESRIYTVDTGVATDISASTFDSGLQGANYTPVAKTLLWSGAVSPPFGANLEGLTLGPQLANGNWSLLGVVDNSGVGGGNLIVSFELTPPDFAGDFNRDGLYGCGDIDLLVGQILLQANDPAFDLTGDGLVNGADQQQWLMVAGAALGYGESILPGDANLDGNVDTGDLDVWIANRFSLESGWCGGDFNHSGGVDLADLHLWNENRDLTTLAIPEPVFGSALIWALAVLPGMRRGNPRKTL